jgi:hypothetical protein
METSNPGTPTRGSPITAILLLTIVVLAQACGSGASGSGHDAGSNGATGGAASGGTTGGSGGSGGASTAGSGSGGVQAGTGGLGAGGATTSSGGGGGIQAGTGGAGVGGSTRGTGGAGGGGVGGGTGGQSAPDASPIPDASSNTDTSPALDGDRRDAPVGKDNASADSAGDVGAEDSPARDSADAPADVGQDNVGTDMSADSDAPAAASLDDCFAGLPAPVGTQIVSNKSSGDGRVHVRLALDTLNNMGLGYAWSLLRFGIEIDGTVTCIKDKAALKYTMSRHNCTDTASATSGTTRYEMGSPSDTMTSLQIFEGGTQTSSMTLTTNACTRTGSSVACPPTGPC